MELKTLGEVYKDIKVGDKITFFDVSNKRGGIIAVHGVVGKKSDKGALYIWQDFFDGETGGTEPEGYNFAWRARQKSDAHKFVVLHK